MNKKIEIKDDMREQIRKMVEEANEEERISAELEKNSTLTYQSGEKVERKDVFIDLKAKEMYEKGEDSLGYHLYIHRINDDGTLDVCINSNFALKFNSYDFSPSNAILVVKNAQLYSPLDELFKGMKSN